MEGRNTFVPGFHIDAISEHLQALFLGQIRKLIINIPPRHMKSLLACVFFPVWCWVNDPSTRFMFASYSGSLSLRDAKKARRLIESDWFRSSFGDVVQLTKDQTAVHRYDTTATGFRFTTSVKGSVMGEGGDILGLDDVHNGLEAQSATKRQGVEDWYRQSWASRVNDAETARHMLIGQRLHEADLSGVLLAEGGWEHLCLPAEYVPTVHVTCLGWSDPRTVPGELLWPQRISREALEDLKINLGRYAAAGQLQQTPAPAEGGMFRRDAWKFWGPGGDKALPRLDLLVRSWDLAFTEGVSTSFVVGQLWGFVLRDQEFFLLDQYKARIDFSATKLVMTTTYKADQVHMAVHHKQSVRLTGVLVEKKANGDAILSELKREIPIMVPITPHGSKEARAAAFSPRVDQGKVYLPVPALAPWVSGLIETFAKFPNATSDDEVDAASQMGEWLLMNADRLRRPSAMDPAQGSRESGIAGI